MAIFRIRAGTQEGRIISKEVCADSREALGSQLEKEGLCPLDIRTKGMVSVAGSLLKRRKKVSTGDLLVFNQGFSTLLKAGLSVVDSLDTIKRSSKNFYFAETIEDVIEGIRSGQALSFAMKSHQDVFPPFYISTISAGEKTGDLIPSIVGYVEYQKRIEAIRKKVISSSTYPLVLAGASALVVVFLLAYVVPSFTRIYLDTGAQLPLPTRMLIHTTEFIRNYILFFIAAAILILFGVGTFFKSGKGCLYLDRIKLVFPQLGEIYLGYTISKFTRTLSMVLKSGIPLLNALRMTKGVLNNKVLDDMLSRVIKKTEEGESVADSMSETNFMPEITLRMFAVGEKSASLHGVLEEISVFHDEEVTHKVEILTGLIEPALMVIMGFIIGTIVVLMYLPIFQLGASL